MASAPPPIPAAAPGHGRGLWRWRRKRRRDLSNTVRGNAMRLSARLNDR